VKVKGVAVRMLVPSALTAAIRVRIQGHQFVDQWTPATPGVGRAEDEAGGDTTSRFDGASWAVLLLSLIVLVGSAALTVYRLRLPSDGRSFFDDPSPGITFDYEGTTLLAVEGVPVDELVRGAAVLQPRQPPRWQLGEIVQYTTSHAAYVGYEYSPTYSLRSTTPVYEWMPLLGGVRVTIPLVLGLYLFWRRPRSTATRLVLLYGVFPLAAYVTRSATNGWNEIRVADIVDGWAFWPTLLVLGLDEIGFATLLHLALIFPTAKGPMRDHPRATVAAVYGVPMAAVLLHNPAQPLAHFLGAWTSPVGMALLTALVGAILVTVGHTLATARETTTNGPVRWVGWGIALPAGSLLVALLVIALVTLANWLGIDLSVAVSDDALGIFFAAAGIVPLAFPLALVVALVRYRLFGIDTIINRTMVYGLLSVMVVGVYIGVVGFAGLLFNTQQTLGLSILATGLIAVLFQPLRERLQREVNRLTYGERDDPYAVLARLGERLEATLAPEAVLPTLVETVALSLKLPFVAVALRANDPAGASSGEFEIVAQYPATVSPKPATDTVALPLVYQGETIGRLLVAPRAHGDRFSATDYRLLTGIAHQAGVAAHAVQLTAALQGSRERLVTLREEERRRLRRDLHDGLGPRLAALALKLETARNRLGSDPLADRLLSELIAQTGAAVDDVRRLVYALRPQALDELGLLPALEEAAAAYSRHEVGGLRVRVEAPEEDLPPLSAAVEVAAYRIVQEALTNVTRHARARTCVVRLGAAEAGWLTVEVEDDGEGLARPTRRGVGLLSMRERAEELGGSCLVEARPEGGTRVLARLPYARYEPRERGV
jgi:signal transduction histidine kinase